MKIKLFAGGGFAYLPTVNRSDEAVASAASTSSSSSRKLSGYADRISDMLKQKGLDNDVASFSNFVNLTLDLANDPFGDNISMKEIIKLSAKASSVQTNYEAYQEARKRLDTNQAWDELALDTRGNLYAMDSNQKVKTVSLNEFKANSQNYIPLTNKDLMTLRRTSPDMVYDTDVIDSLQKAVSTNEIVKYAKDRINDFGKNSLTGYSSKVSSGIQKGFQDIVDATITGSGVGNLIAAGPDGIYKITEEASTSENNIAGAVSLIINEMSPQYQHTLRAKAMMEGFTPEALLVQMITSNTDRKLSVDYDASASKAAGYDTGDSSKEKDPNLQIELAETYATGQGAGALEPVEITRNNGKNSLIIWAQPVQSIFRDKSGKPGTPMGPASIPEIFESGYGVGGVRLDGITFGDRTLTSEEASLLVYTGGMMERTELPARRNNKGEIVPDFELQDELQEIVNNGKTQGADESIINRYLQEKCKGAKYDAKTDTIQLPEGIKHAFLTFQAAVPTNYLDLSDSDYLQEGEFNQDIYLKAITYGEPNPNGNKPTERAGIDETRPGGWFFGLGHKKPSSRYYMGNVFIPVNPTAGATVYNPEYTFKGTHTDIQNKDELRRRKIQLMDQINSGERPTSWNQ